MEWGLSIKVSGIYFGAVLQKEWDNGHRAGLRCPVEWGFPLVFPGINVGSLPQEHLGQFAIVGDCRHV